MGNCPLHPNRIAKCIACNCGQYVHTFRQLDYARTQLTVRISIESVLNPDIHRPIAFESVQLAGIEGSALQIPDTVTDRLIVPSHITSSPGKYSRIGFYNDQADESNSTSTISDAMIASILSINVGLPRDVVYGDRIVATGIFKTPIIGRIEVRTLGLEGDGQADLTVHGGPAKAVYAYPSEHYEYWAGELNLSLPYGMFGENLTTRGLLEESLHIGDRFHVGSAELVVTEPRFPCYKLGIRFGAMDMVKRFQESGRSGFYLAVSKEGEIEKGDALRLTSRNPSNPTIAEVFNSDSS